MFTVVIDNVRSRGVRYQFITEGCETLTDANRVARCMWHQSPRKDVYILDEKGNPMTGDSFDSRKLRDFYIVVEDKESGESKIVGRRKAMLFEMNEQAAWIWNNLFRKWDRKTHHVLVQGELNGEIGFDSERPESDE